MSQPDHARSDTAPILVRVAPELIEHMAADGSGPVLLIGIDKQDDGTHEMTFKRAPIDPHRERYEKAIRACLDTEPVTGLPWVQASPHEARRWLEAALLPDERGIHGD